MLQSSLPRREIAEARLWKGVELRRAEIVHRLLGGLVCCARRRTVARRGLLWALAERMAGACPVASNELHRRRHSAINGQGEFGDAADGTFNSTKLHCGRYDAGGAAGGRLASHKGYADSLSQPRHIQILGAERRRLPTTLPLCNVRP